jgi:hypothetical protein
MKSGNNKKNQHGIVGISFFADELCRFFFFLRASWYLSCIINLVIMEDRLFDHQKEAVAGADTTFWCRLFSDRITMLLCDRRRRELDARGGFSCNDCATVAGHEGPGADSP